MNKRKLFSALAVLAALVAIHAPVSHAQVNTAAPIVVKQSAPKPVWLTVEVLHADQLSILVREEANGMNIHTFSYSDKAREKIQAVLDAGGFQYGDKIKIRYLPGKTEALDVKGTPPK
jgi:hypothetical protein